MGGSCVVRVFWIWNLPGNTISRSAEVVLVVFLAMMIECCNLPLLYSILCAQVVIIVLHFSMNWFVWIDVPEPNIWRFVLLLSDNNAFQLEIYQLLDSLL